MTHNSIHLICSLRKEKNYKFEVPVWFWHLLLQYLVVVAMLQDTACLATAVPLVVSVQWAVGHIFLRVEVLYRYKFSDHTYNIHGAEIHYFHAISYLKFMYFFLFRSLMTQKLWNICWRLIMRFSRQIQRKVSHL